MVKESKSKFSGSHPRASPAMYPGLPVCWHEVLYQLVKCSGSNAWPYHTVFTGIRQDSAGEGVLLRLCFGFPDPLPAFPVLLPDLQRQSMLWVSSLSGVRVEWVLGGRWTVVPAGWGDSTPGRWRRPAGCWWWWRDRPWREQLDPPAGFPDTTCSPRWRAELSL